MGARLALAAIVLVTLLGAQRVGVDLALLPDDLRPQVERALAAGNVRTAEQLVVDAVAQKHPRSRDLLLFAASLFLADNQPLNAAISYAKADAMAPLDEPQRFSYAMSQIAAGRKDGARTELKKLMTAAPRKALYPYWLGRIDYDEQRFEAALGWFDKAIALDVSSVRAHDNRGLALEALGRNEEAVASYRKAAELNRTQNGNSPWPGHNLGALLVKLGELEPAEAALRDSVRLDATFAKAHYQLGLVLEKKGSAKPSLAEYETARRLDPEYAPPLYALGRAYRKAGDAKRSAEAFAAFERLKARQRGALEARGEMSMGGHGGTQAAPEGQPTAEEVAVKP
jgi:tetratricopeptide (TPR) repeat protein